MPLHRVVVIGINTQDHLQDPWKAEDDARETAELLREKFGFEDVTLPAAEAGTTSS